MWRQEWHGLKRGGGDSRQPDPLERDKQMLVGCMVHCCLPSKVQCMLMGDQ
jgi:hypothetical protein